MHKYIHQSIKFIACYLLVLQISCADTQTDVSPTELKIQTQVGSITNVATSKALDDFVLPTLDPNHANKQTILFSLSNGTNLKLPEVEYAIHPPLILIPSVTSVTNAGGIYMLTVTNAYTVTEDKTYTLTAKTSNITLDRKFNIKATNIPIQTITLTRKIDQLNIKGIVGSATVDLSSVFDINVQPSNATNQTVIWLIEEGQNVVASVTKSGILTPITDGEVSVKVGSSSEGDKFSNGLIFEIISYKIQAKLGANEQEAKIFNVVGDIVDLSLDPNEEKKLYLEFTLLEGLTPQKLGVSFLTTPDLTSISGIKTSNGSNSGIFSLTLMPEIFNSTEDITYTLSATIGTAPTIVRTRAFVIKGKEKIIPIQTIVIARKAEQKNTKGIVGTARIDLSSIFDISIQPSNATNQEVLWLIEPIQDAVATMTENGILTPIAEGEIFIKVNAISEVSKFSNLVPFVISSYKIQAKVGANEMDAREEKAVTDIVIPELNPNGTEKLFAEFKVLEGNSLKKTDVRFSVSPNLTTIPGITISNEENSGIYTLTLVSDLFSVVDEVTYLLTATVGVSPVFVTNRKFIIKGKMSVGQPALNNQIIITK